TEYEFANTIRIAPKGAVPAAGPGQFVSTIGTSADRNATINIAVPTNLWVQWHDLPYLGNIRVGNQKQWISMEHLTSNRFLEFLERSFAFDAFIDNGNESYVPGISVWRSLLDQNLFVGAGYYVPSYLQYFGWNVGDGEGQFVARLAGTPYFAENGRYMLHLGLGYMHSTADDGAIRFRSRAQIRNGPGVMQNVLAMIQGNLNNYNLIVPEFMVNYGSFTVQAEYYGTWVHQPSSSSFSAVGNQTNPGNLPPGGRGGLIYHGGYVQTGYFLTGESRGYDRVFQVPTRQPVHENAFCVEGEEGRTFGRGAWEVVSRFEWLNLNSKSVNGGMLYGGTLGLNWYFNPNSKFQIDYCIAYRDATEYLNGQVAPDGTSIRSGWIQGLGTRFAFDF
ncbi:MAG: porin, partial [Gemmataceae bacterium]